LKVTVNFYAIFREIAGGKTFELNLSGTTVRDLIETFREQINERIYDKIKRLLDDNTAGLLILINGRNIAHLEGLETKIKEKDRIDIFPPGAGG